MGLVLQKSWWSTTEARRVHQIRLIGLYDYCNWIELGLKPRIAKKTGSNASIFVDLRALKDALFRRLSGVTIEYDAAAAAAADEFCITTITTIQY